MSERRAHWEAGVLEREEIDERMSAIRHAIVADEADQDVLLLTDEIPDSYGHYMEESEPQTISGHEPATAIAEVLLDVGHLPPEEVAEILRAEFRHWLETDGRMVLAQLLDEIVERDQQET